MSNLKLRRPVLLILLAFMGLSAAAQVQFAAIAGPQLTSAYYSIGGVRQHRADFKPGVMTGMAMKVVFDNQLYFFPAIYYSRKGYKVDFTQPSYPPSPDALNNNTTLNTIEAAALFQIDLAKSARHAFIRLGPAVDAALSGKETFQNKTPNGTQTVSRPMTFSFTSYGRYTASLNFHLGFEGKKWMGFAFYNYGVGSLNNEDGGPHILHRIMGLAAGWYFASAGK